MGYSYLCLNYLKIFKTLPRFQRRVLCSFSSHLTRIFPSYLLLYLFGSFGYKYGSRLLCERNYKLGYYPQSTLSMDPCWRLKYQSGKHSRPQNECIGKKTTKHIPLFVLTSPCYSMQLKLQHTMVL